MKDEDRKIIYAAIRKHGDSFWNDLVNGDETSWNGYLVEDIDVALQKEGYELVVRKVGAR